MRGRFIGAISAAAPKIVSLALRRDGMQLAVLPGVISQSPSTRFSTTRFPHEQQLSLILFSLAFWIVCAVEWTRWLTGGVADPRFWPLLSLMITACSGLQIFRLRLRMRDAAPRAVAGTDDVAAILNGMRGKGWTAFRDVP